MRKKKKNILWFEELTKKDVSRVGGKNASLGEMYSMLSEKGVNIPNGFALTADSFWYFLKHNNIDKKIKNVFRSLNPNKIKSIQETGRKARTLILDSKFPKDLEKEIDKSYSALSLEYGASRVSVAVRSSATAEDGAEASFAGQHETYLNVSGKEELKKAIKKCMASLFTSRAIAYREEKGFNHLKIALSVGVQKMVKSDEASSGVMFTLDTESGFRDVVLINSIWGVGEMIVKGLITPDEFFVFKPTFKRGFKSIIVKNLGRKNKKYIYSSSGGLREIPVPQDKQLEFSITEKEILQLAKWGMIIEEHYKNPQDIEWAKDAETGELFIVQARPETVHSISGNSYLEYHIKTKKKPVLTGIAIGNKIGQGKVRVIPKVSDISKFKKGEILVTKMTDPDWLPALRMASGVISNEGGKTCFSSHTKILTNDGFMTMQELHTKINSGNYHQLFTVSLDVDKNKIVWRPIVKTHKREAQLNKILVSPSLRSKQNFIEATENHEFLTLKNRHLEKKMISSIVEQNEGVLVSQSIPRYVERNFNFKESYLLGALFSDGSASINKQGGYTVSFHQKLLPHKQQFINTVNEYFNDVYNKNLKLVTIESRRLEGNFNCYSKEVYTKVMNRKEQLVIDMLSVDEDSLRAFLGGILDGDGNVSEHQIQITVGKKNILEAIVVASSRLGMVPSICKRENHWIVSFDRKFSKKILSYTQRVNKNFLNFEQEHRQKFIASQVIEDIIHLVDSRGRIKHDYLTRNNMITDYKIRKFIIPKLNNTLKKEFNNLLAAPFSMQKVKIIKKEKDKKDVYNITVAADSELDHNYVVFTENYTPIIVANCHAAIVSRELGIPAIVGTGNATEKLKNGKMVTVDCTQGLNGRVFEGKVSFSTRKYNLKRFKNNKVRKTKIMMNIAAPDIAFKTSRIPNDGVGLAREEFIIAEKIRIHPLALYHYNKLKDKKLKNEIAKITIEHKNKREYFVKELAEGVGQIAAAFYPKPVIVRLSDFKTNEYRNLIGGELFEAEEENPMIGFRGAGRYLDKTFQPAFLMELESIKRARKVFGLTNIKVMVPFCRTIKEGKNVLTLMKKAGLQSGKDGLEIYVMCELPSNVVLAREFLEIFDGMSIGSNDLTQLTLGIDRDNSRIQHIGDERNMAVIKMIKEVINLCQVKRKYCGICGQAPSDFPDFAKFLVKQKIESISLNPDTVIKTMMRLSQ